MKKSLIGLLAVSIPFAASAADKSQYNIFNPTPEKEMRAFSTDRPGKMDTPTTVDAGHFQFESDIWNYSRNRFNEGGSNNLTETTAVFPTSFKVGLTNNTELQVIAGTYLIQRGHDYTAGTLTKKNGYGDTVARVKWNLVGNDSGATAFAVIPYVKIPTNQDDLSNNDYTAGFTAPLTYTLNPKISLGYMFGYNRNSDSDNHGYHNEFINLGKVTYTGINNWAPYVELFTLINGERSADDFASTLDFATTYMLTPNLQLDAGFNIGLTRNTDDFNPFVGISARF